MFNIMIATYITDMWKVSRDCQCDSQNTAVITEYFLIKLISIQRYFNWDYVDTVMLWGKRMTDYEK